MRCKLLYNLDLGSLTGMAHLRYQRQMLSPKSSATLQKIARSQFAISPSERKALQDLFWCLEAAGVSVISLCEAAH